MHSKLGGRTAPMRRQWSAVQATPSYRTAWILMLLSLLSFLARLVYIETNAFSHDEMHNLMFGTLAGAGDYYARQLTIADPADDEPLLVYATGEWRREELNLDPYTLTVAADAPPGGYTLLVGMYDEVRDRLPVLVGDGSGPGDAIPLQTIEVQAP